MGIRGQVTPGDEGAHIDVVREDIMTDELAEEQHEIRELHSLALVPGLSFTDTQRPRFSSFILHLKV